MKAYPGNLEQICEAMAYSGNAEHRMGTGALWNPFQTSGLLLECKCVLFLATNFVVTDYSSHRKLIQVPINLIPQEPHIFERYLVCLKVLPITELSVRV